MQNLNDTQLQLFADCLKREEQLENSRQIIELTKLNIKKSDKLLTDVKKMLEYEN